MRAQESAARLVGEGLYSSKYIPVGTPLTLCEEERWTDVALCGLSIS